MVNIIIGVVILFVGGFVGNIILSAFKKQRRPESHPIKFVETTKSSEEIVNLTDKILKLRTEVDNLSNKKQTLFQDTVKLDEVVKGFNQKIEELNKQGLESQVVVKEWTEKIEELAPQVKKLKELEENISKLYAAEKRSKKLKEENPEINRIVLAIDEELTIKVLYEASRKTILAAEISKLLWTSIVQTRFQAMVKALNITSSPAICGIYKITNHGSQECYVGQSVDIRTRWSQHIKSVLGEEKATGKNLLYPAMREYGISNFTFEVLEECPRDKLNEREDYWQIVFKAKETGYSLA